MEKYQLRVKLSFYPWENDHFIPNLKILYPNSKNHQNLHTLCKFCPKLKYQFRKI